MREPCFYIQQIFHWQGRSHSQQHSCGAAINSWHIFTNRPDKSSKSVQSMCWRPVMHAETWASSVVFPQAVPRTVTVIIPARDDQGGASAIVCHVIQVVAVRRVAMFATEVRCTGQRQTSQPVNRLESFPQDLNRCRWRHCWRSLVSTVHHLETTVERGTVWHKSGTSRKIRDGWQPYTTYTS